MHYKLALIGFGNVARALARLFVRKQDLLKEKHGVTFSFTGISTGRHGFAVNPDGLDIQKALELVESGKDISSLSSLEVKDSLAVIQHSQADVMFENSPVNTQTGQPALDHIRTALNLEMHAITANKGPVVYGYRELTALAKGKGKMFRFEPTVLGGAPVFSVMREAFPLAELSSFKGILNATTNIILSAWKVASRTKTRSSTASRSAWRRRIRPTMWMAGMQPSRLRRWSRYCGILR
jgi:homoserine dehydrogenase